MFVHLCQQRFIAEFKYILSIYFVNLIILSSGILTIKTIRLKFVVERYLYTVVLRESVLEWTKLKLSKSPGIFVR